MTYLYVKRLFDFLFAFIGLIILSPVFLLIALLLWVFQKGNPFFVQKRPGRNAKLFRLIKFKTMRDIRDEAGELLPDEKRLTGIGKLVRKTSLDEIPQLINVLKGDMSFIGPRPLLEEYLPLYSEEQAKRHLVRPGISGWAQVNGRNKLSWEEKFAFDVWYVKHQSLGLDLRILFMTMRNVLKAEGISGEGSETMHKFEGNRTIS